MEQSINFIEVERYWFLTWTTYGTWLPGDERGYVGIAPDESGALVNHNQFGMPSANPNTGLREWAESRLKSPPIVFSSDQAELLFKQFQETMTFRRWLPIAIGIMRTHLHVVTGVPGDPDPEKILGDLKAYGSRSLTRAYGKPASETWWTHGGSKRKLGLGRSLDSAVQYIREQDNPLLIWTREDGRLTR